MNGAFFETLVAALPEAIVVSTPDGRILYVNAALEDLLGYKAAELDGAEIQVLVPRQPGQRADPVKWLARWAGEGLQNQSRYLDLTGRTKEGLEMPVDVRVSEAMFDGDKRFVISVRDHSARRDEMVRTKETHLLMSRILAVAADAIISVDAAQHITFFNLTAEKMFGYSSEEVMGQSLDVLLPLRFRKLHGKEIEDFARSKQASRFMNERGAVVGLRKDGTEFPVEATITKVTSGGKPTFTAHLREKRTAS